MKSLVPLFFFRFILKVSEIGTGCRTCGLLSRLPPKKRPISFAGTADTYAQRRNDCPPNPIRHGVEHAKSNLSIVRHSLNHFSAESLFQQRNDPAELRLRGWQVRRGYVCELRTNGMFRSHSRSAVAEMRGARQGPGVQKKMILQKPNVQQTEQVAAKLCRLHAYRCCSAMVGT